MSVERIVIVLVCIGVLALFAFQLWSVLRTGHVRWRAQKVHRAHRPVAFWLEVGACLVGLLLFAGLLAANFAQ
ncbi:MAG TPA: hypothetical protein VLX44_02255 [Xanthobacteraceae bacterium]|nr:hypothetical protein [Xanthobacteraceae bacterium]